MNTPTVPLGRKKSEPTSIPKSRTASVAESIPSQPGPDQANRRRIRKLPNVQSVRRYAQVVRQTAKRLSHTVREATADGSLGSTEISRLHIWVTADLVP